MWYQINADFRSQPFPTTVFKALAEQGISIIELIRKWINNNSDNSVIISLV